jgi:thiol-disulfide isomerase/thioredoxin
MESDECTKEFSVFAKEELLKKERKKTLEKKKSLMRKQDYEKILEAHFNEFIRLRDWNESCISCDAPAQSFKKSAGHYFPAGHNKNIRFDEDNVHNQCWYNCNKQKHGNLSEYLPRLIKKIGQERFDELELKKRMPRHYSIPELIELIVIYKDKVKAEKKRLGEQLK